MSMRMGAPPVWLQVGPNSCSRGQRRRRGGFNHAVDLTREDQRRHGAHAMAGALPHRGTPSRRCQKISCTAATACSCRPSLVGEPTSSARHVPGTIATRNAKRAALMDSAEANRAILPPATSHHRIQCCRSADWLALGAPAIVKIGVDHCGRSVRNIGMRDEPLDMTDVVRASRKHEGNIAAQPTRVYGQPMTRPAMLDKPCREPADFGAC